ncbi:hypothetical protein LZ31DRAFT_557345 [Colletotrichum somersetense]|nr:hypothetical protein LZ31DRAFT_557345 [Colletotrichum somersetense]
MEKVLLASLQVVIKPSVSDCSTGFLVVWTDAVVVRQLFVLSKSWLWLRAKARRRDAFNKITVGLSSTWDVHCTSD